LVYGSKGRKIAGTALFLPRAAIFRYYPLSGWQGDVHARPTVAV
jgi:hypothetical protein